jgi:hypothetical protein
VDVAGVRAIAQEATARLERAIAAVKAADPIPVPCRA